MSLLSIPRISVLVGLTAAALAASPAIAGEITTRVVRCTEGSCLQVTGRRVDARAAVSINGHSVTADGARKWRVRLPVETVREWSAPLARTITVSIRNGGNQSDFEARLPIGLLGQAEDLALLVVSIK